MVKCKDLEGREVFINEQEVVYITKDWKVVERNHSTLVWRVRFKGGDVILCKEIEGL